jgi:hypothetical protein
MAKLKWWPLRICTDRVEYVDQKPILSVICRQDDRQQDDGNRQQLFLPQTGNKIALSLRSHDSASDS